MPHSIREQQREERYKEEAVHRFGKQPSALQVLQALVDSSPESPYRATIHPRVVHHAALMVLANAKAKQETPDAKPGH